MGALIYLVTHLTLPHVCAGLFILFAAILLFKRIQEAANIKRLGSRAAQIPCPLFGIGFIYEGVRAIHHHCAIDLWERRLQYGNKSSTAEAYVLGKRIILTADVENIKAITCDKFKDFEKGNSFRRSWAAFLGRGIFTTDGAEWHANRKLMRPFFATGNSQDLTVFEDNLMPTSTRVVDIAQLFTRYCTDVSMTHLFGFRTNALLSDQDKLSDALMEVIKGQKLKERYSKLSAFLPKRKLKSALKSLDECIYRHMDTAKLQRDGAAKDDADPSKDNLFAFLHASQTERQAMRDHLVTSLLASRDTTACALSWTLFELARNPSSVTSIRQEIDQVLQSRHTPPTPTQLKQMPYLNAVINETLRLYPSIPFTSRVAAVDTTLPRGGGPEGDEPVAVPKGTKVGISLMLMHYATKKYPSFSPDPETFCPERWLLQDPPEFAYMPFLGGPRVCIGQSFAILEIGYTLCRLFQTFSSVSGHMPDIHAKRPNIDASIVLLPAHGVNVSFHV